ncbi:MAG: cellulose binding domain-containing protein, partial [Cyanobacteria bacterium P01_F01_bin.150]
MLNFSIVNDWNHGFTGKLSLTNLESTAINGWTIEFEAPFEITNIWGAKILRQDGDRYTIQNENWNRNVASGEEISFGFNGKGAAVEPTGYALNGMAIAPPPEPAPMDPVLPSNPIDSSDSDEPVTDHNQDADSVDPMASTNPAMPMDSADSVTEHNHDMEHNHGGEHNHDEEPLPDNLDSGPLADGGQIFYSDGTTQRITNFDPSKDKVDIGTDSIHNQIPIDTPDGLVFQNMFNPSRSLTLVGVYLEDLSAENFNPIADAHLQQDLSAALAWENGTGYVRPNTVYIRSHEEGVQEAVDFNPATDKISFFYLSVRGDNELNFSVEQTGQGVRFYSPITEQSMTLLGTQFSDLNSSHFEWRANQLEDNIAGRMGLSDKISNFRIVSENVFSGKSVPMAGLVDRAPYHSNPDYTGTRIDANTDLVNPIDLLDPVDPIDPVDPTDPIDPMDPVTPTDPGTDHTDSDGHNHGGDPADPAEPISSNSDVDFDITNNWGSGYQGEGKITNNEGSALNGWTLEFEFSGNITQIWDADIVSQNGNTYVIKNAAYNGTVASGQEVSFGFLGNGSTSTLPSVFKLNGVVVGSTAGPTNPVDPIEPVIPVDPDMPMDPADSGSDHNHDMEHNHDGEHNHDEDPLPDNMDTGPLADGGQTFYSDGSTQRITNFDPAKDKVDIGTDSIHNQIPIDTPDGLVFQNMFNPGRSLTLVGI